MPAAICFNNKLCFQTYEIKNVVLKRVLPAEFQAFDLPAS